MDNPMAKQTKLGPAKPRKPKRAIGRPSDPARLVGRDALIAATCELLRTMPPKEISFLKIARLCGANPSLVSYHFGDRLGLLTAVAERLTTEFDPGVAALAAGESSEDQFRARVGRILELEALNPFFHRLMLEELLPSSETLVQDLLRRLNERGLEAYRNIFSRGIARGELGDVDVELLFVMNVAICQTFDNTHRNYELVVGHEVDRDEFLNKYEKFVGDILLQGVVARGG